MRETLLFVYGTLMQTSGHEMHHVLGNHSEFLCHGWVSGQLYQIQDYPGLVLSECEDDKVYGEVYRLRDLSVLDQLDDFEECSAAFPEPHEYIRQQITVSVSDDEQVSAWGYVYNYPVDKARQIKSGRFGLS